MKKVRKKKAHRRWMSAKRNRNPEEARLHLTKARNKVKKILRKAKKLYERGIAMDAKKNPKKFWLHARSKLNTKTGVAPLLENVADKNSLRFDDKGKADLLQRQFLSVFTKESSEGVPKLSPRTASFITRLCVLEEDVQKKLRSLNPYKSCGPDEIQSRLLRELADYLAGPIAALFNSTLHSREVPADWKKLTFLQSSKRAPKVWLQTTAPSA